MGAAQRDTMLDLTGKVAFVSGAEQDVGAAVAAQLAQRGAKVGANDIFAERAKGTAAAIANSGGTAMAAPANDTDCEQIVGAIRSLVDAYGPVDILVNNAGVPPEGFSVLPFRQTTQNDWDNYIKSDIHGAMYSAQAVLESIQNHRFGRIITIVADSGRFGEPSMAAYVALKAAAAGFMRALAKETARFGVTRNSLSLGSIEPPVELRTERDEKRARLYPMHQLGRPDVIAGTVTYLASNEAGWGTGPDHFDQWGDYVASQAQHVDEAT